jgi:D-alanyl-D-alanine carboxypeptidase (penicillin-binding protein 5/6)
MDLGVLQEGRLRRSIREQQARRRRRRRIAGFGAVLVGAAVIALLMFMSSEASGPAIVSRAGVGSGGQSHHHATTPARPEYGVALAARARVRPHFKLPVTSGLLFDVRTGRVLWERRQTSRLPIASLTKMMTALVVVAHATPGERVLITRAAIDYSGSGVGLLPLHKKVRLETLLYGLMLPSGNDAAIALAQHVAGTQGRFIAMMNARAHEMGLRCTHFTTVSGIVDHGNYSCASDLAVIAHAVLTQRRLGRIVATRDAVLPFPIKGGKLWLYNNNPLLRMRYPGADGVKTGYTLAAGPCLVAAARRGHKWLAVVLLHSDDPPGQAQKLLNAGFATRGA